MTEENFQDIGKLYGEWQDLHAHLEKLCRHENTVDLVRHYEAKFPADAFTMIRELLIGKINEKMADLEKKVKNTWFPKTDTAVKKQKLPSKKIKPTT